MNRKLLQTCSCMHTRGCKKEVTALGRPEKGRNVNERAKASAIERLEESKDDNTFSTMNEIERAFERV
eukprot:6213902-Pleurochrysis_carterae.AAC.2